MNHPLDSICDLIQEDVGKRGLRKDASSNLITSTTGQFQEACRAIAKSTNPAIGIVTGFYIPHGQPPSGETDGPLGALFIARALAPLGMKIVIASDEFCIRALEIGLAACGLQKQVTLVTLPSYGLAEDLGPAAYWKYFSELAGPLSYLVALERAGPSYTLEALQAQLGSQEALGETYLAFLNDVSREHQDRCHTMGGKDITTRMSPAHWLFEQAPRHAAVRTIGIGDGGNEIGMGKIRWDVIRRNINNGGLVACRVPCDYLIVSGISNWGAYGLAAAVRWLCGQPPQAPASQPGYDLFDRGVEAHLLRAMVEGGPLVDGVTGKPTVTVDGIPFDRYSEILSKLVTTR